ncbi:unnamed protein product [Mycena citricolor]|uniref:Uncharacterized protein n=1 Tax=Mycena citricolor TaxID=2018698 RepID=A0AAD2Q0A4_9AGAR|nr:unnamed protein product [Mycena citricolor]
MRIRSSGGRKSLKSKAINIGTLQAVADIMCKFRGDEIQLCIYTIDRLCGIRSGRHSHDENTRAA